MLDSGFRNQITGEEVRIEIDSFHPCEICVHPKIKHYARSAEVLNACMVYSYKENKFIVCSCNLYLPMAEKMRLLLL